MKSSRRRKRTRNENEPADHLRLRFGVGSNPIEPAVREPALAAAFAKAMARHIILAAS